MATENEMATLLGTLFAVAVLERSDNQYMKFIPALRTRLARLVRDLVDKHRREVRRIVADLARKENQ